VRRLVCACSLLAALALPPTAAAKGPVSALDVCGADGCAQVAVPQVLRGPMGLEQLMVRASAIARPPSPRPFYRLRVRFGDASLTVYYLPGGALLRDQDWVRLSPRLSAELDRVVTTFAPVPVRLSAVRIQGRRVPDPAAYRPLLGHLRPPRDGTAGADVTSSVGLYLQTSAPTPWGLGRVVFALYDPRSHLIDIAGTTVEPGAQLRHAIERDAGIASPGDGSTSVWAGGGIALIASAAALALARRKVHASGRRE
jgi:hypothetical protein